MQQQQQVSLNTAETEASSMQQIQRRVETPNPAESIEIDSSNGNRAFQGSSSSSSLSSPPSNLRIAPESAQHEDEANMALHYGVKGHQMTGLLPSLSLGSRTNHHAASGRVHGSTTYQQARDPGGRNGQETKLAMMTITQSTSLIARSKGSYGEDSGKAQASLTSEQKKHQQREPLNMSDGSGNSGNVVTTTTATNTSSGGDDPDSSWGNGMGAISMPQDESCSDVMRLHHLRHQARRRVLENDSSTLQLPRDDGSPSKILRGPSAVVASRLLPPNSDTTTNVSSSGSGGEVDPFKENLLKSHRESGYHPMRKRFNKLPSRHGEARHGPQTSATDSSSSLEGTIASRTKSPGSSSKAAKLKLTSKKTGSQRRDTAAIRFRDPSPSPDSEGSITEGGEGSSSGSGTEGGYAGSASSNSGQQESSCSSSPSVSSTEESQFRSMSRRHRSRKGLKPPKRSESIENYSSSSSSEIADFSSGASMLNEDNAVELSINDFDESVQSASPSLSLSNERDDLDDLEVTYLHAKRAVEEDQVKFIKATTKKRKAADVGTWSRKTPAEWPRPDVAVIDSESKLDRRPPILSLGSDVMAQVFTFLNPPDIMDVLSMPLSKDWRETVTLQPELWRTLCLAEPFKAKMEDYTDSDTNENSFVSLDRYRLLYTSFVRCMKYLSQIREDALNGREPTFIDYGGIAQRGRNSKRGPPLLLGSNRNLQLFLARARGAVEEAKSEGVVGVAKVSAGRTTPDKRSAAGSYPEDRIQRKKPKLAGRSMITDRLLGPSKAGDVGNLALPWSCAIYSIVNWMVAFLDVEGIQILCLKVLPFLLEDEKQRMTAQRTGLTDVILRAMILFDKSEQLHIAAFHTIVLLARPLGGKEGMLFHSSMLASGIFGSQTSQHRKNGIAVMLDSMRRFEDNEILQAMSCWALVNIALAPAQKAVLVKLGGIQVTLNAMSRHPFNAEVQFRALFALINLVIPSISLNRTNSDPMQDQLGETNNKTTEKEIIDGLVGKIGVLVVRAMTNLCSSEAILNRACLVLHNLSLTPGYHETLLWTPNCYQMLEWCLANYRTDQVLQQSASGTLNRLQTTLSNDISLRTRFADSLNAQHRRSLQQAHNEAVRINEQEEQLNGLVQINQVE